MSEIKTRRCASGLVIENFFARLTNKFYKNGSSTLSYYFDEHFYYLKSYNEVIAIIQDENVEGEQCANIDLHNSNEFVIHLFDKTSKGGNYFSQTTSKHIGLVKNWIKENSLTYLYYNYQSSAIYDLIATLQQPKLFIENNIDYADDEDNMDVFIIDNFQYIKALQE